MTPRTTYVTCRLPGPVNGHDAAYVALAEGRGLTLVTGDARLALAAVPHCRVLRVLPDLEAGGRQPVR